MVRALVSILACAMVLLNFIHPDLAQAQPIPAISFPSFSVAETTISDAQKELYQKLEDEIIPKIAGVLSPIQRQKFETAIEQGASLRKAFKAITLTPDQKSQLGMMLSSLPKKDIFATLTPEQKKAMFMKKKELFIPTPQEIAEKISEKIKLAEDKVSGGLTAEEIGEKINNKLKSIQEKFSD